MCEFCCTQNEVDVVQEEVPVKEEVMYMLKPSPLSCQNLSTQGGPTTKESIVVFCLDISGSMCVTTEVGYVVLQLDANYRYM